MVVPGRSPQSFCANAEPSFGHRLRGRDLADARRGTQVRGRRSGRGISFPVVIADYEGERYLVSMLGEDSNWVRNVRAAGGWAVLRHGRREAVLLEEVSAGTRAPILRRYLALAPGARPHIPIDRHAPLEAFERIAPEVPVFRITAGSTAPQSGG